MPLIFRVRYLRLNLVFQTLCLLLQSCTISATGHDPGEPVILVRKCSSMPSITIRNSKDELRKAGASYNGTVSEIFIPNKILLTIECISSSPVDFDFKGHLVNNLYSVETFRIPDDPYGDCYSIVVKVETDREATGKYLCWNIDEKQVTPKMSSLYVYADGGSPPYLLLGDIGKSTIDIIANPAENFAVLPCVSTNPNVSVALYSVERETFKLITLGDHVWYDPKTGFTLDLKKFPDPYRTYKCIAQNSTHFDVIVNLLMHEENTVIESDEKLQIFTNKYHENKSAFLCHGSSTVSLKSSLNCKTPIECRLARKCLVGETFCGQSSCQCSFNGDPCSKSLRSKYFHANYKLREGCETVVRNENGGIVHCGFKNSEDVGDKGSSGMYFIGLNRHIVKNWKEAPISELLSVSTTIDGNGGPYYVGEDIKFRCTASRFIFSSGFKWKFKLLNGSVISTSTLDVWNEMSDSYINEEAKIKISVPEIQSVICSAPIWNESNWVDSGVPLKVKDTVAPVFIDPTNITVSFYPNDKNESLICEATGFPSPDIVWLRNGEEFLTNFHFDHSRANVSKSKLTFKEIAETDHGMIYSCNASNPRGMSLKTFTIYVRAHPSTLIFSTVGPSLVILFGIIISISFVLFRRMQKAKNMYTFHFSAFDLEEFTNGNPEAVRTCKDSREKAMYLPYDAETYEVREGELEIDYGDVLGQGEFGVVLKGNLTRNGVTTPVAVKTVKGTDANHLKSILQELKIMMFIGYHKHIATLLGAVTRNLLERRVSVIVEYCSLGNLEMYLRNHRSTFFNEFEPPVETQQIRNPTSQYVQIDYSVKTSDLIKWTYEIATGMEFLMKRKVIHGDVALRNVLLCSNQSIKITDFGLSKQLYKFSDNYVTKRKDTPLPWRWLAIESIQEQHFSIQSDVWSFGITVWELFSLAETPYTGFDFTVDLTDFLALLEHGYRLDMPRFSSREIYSIMRECWRSEAADRPSFTALRHIFANMLPSGMIDFEDFELFSQNDMDRLRENLLHPEEILVREHMLI